MSACGICPVAHLCFVLRQAASLAAAQTLIHTQHEVCNEMEENLQNLSNLFTEWDDIWLFASTSSVGSFVL